MNRIRKRLLSAFMWMGVLALLMSFCCAQPAIADTYTLDSALSGRDDLDWTVASSYSGTYSRDPTAGDTVEIPANMTAKVTAGSTSWTLINTLTRIVPRDKAVFEVNVPSEAEERAVLNTPVTEYNLSKATDSGTLRKTGGGALELASYKNVKHNSTIRDYYLNLDVTAGDLYLCRSGSDKEDFRFADISVADGATLHTCYVGYTYCTGLNGNGFITLDNETQQRIYINGTGSSSYSGWMTGHIRIDITAGRHDITCPTNTIDTICLSGTGICGFTRLGAKQDETVPSSLGSGNFNLSSSSGIIYLGTETESSSKTFWLSSDSFIDAGAYGGLTLTGKFDTSGSGETLRAFTLCGANVNPCIISGTFPGKASQKSVFYLVKKGTGTWCLAHATNRGSLGVIDVEDGTLQFESIAAKGAACSLGYATNLFEKAAGLEYDSGTPVDYAMVLGGDGTEGTLEYTGTTAANNATRKIAVRSKGRFKATGANFALYNAYALGAGEKTLTLDGDAASNTATGLSDGPDGGKLSVVKEGSGRWELQGTNTFTGSLFANAGTLRVRNLGAKYHWYRLCITENIYGSTRYTANKTDATDSEKGYVQFSEFALYDSDGVNLLSGFTTGEPDSPQMFRTNADVRSMPDGTAAYGATAKSWPYNKTDGHLWRIFDNSTNTRLSGNASNSSGGVLLNKSSTWHLIVMKLPDDANVPVRLDFLSNLPNNDTYQYNGRCPTAYRLDGSVDGLRWDTGIARDDALIPPELGSKWYSDPTGSAATGNRPNKGFVISQTSHVVNDRFSFTAVGAANGALLEVLGDPITVTGLVVDASAPAGTISNVVFATGGTLDVRNAELAGNQPLDLPGDYAHLAGVANISKWNLTMDGEAYRARAISVKDGKLSLIQRGIRIILR